MGGLLDDFINSELQNKQIVIETDETSSVNYVNKIDETMDYNNVPELNRLFITLEDIHTGVFNYINETTPVYNKGEKVPVVFAGSSRWSIAKRGYLYDTNTKKLNLPIIAVVHKGTDVDRDRWHPTVKDHETDWKVGSIINSSDPNYIKDIYLSPALPIISQYEIVLWSGSNIEMDRYLFKQITDAFIDFNINVRDFRMYGYLESISDENNFTDYGSTEVIIRKRYNIKIYGYLLDENNVSIINRLTRYNTSLLFKGETITDDISQLDQKYDH